MKNPVAFYNSQQNFSFDLPEFPYPGLRAFRQEEWSIFFGRERMVDEVINKISTSQSILIHGSSGSGKSSLIRAGVIAQLQREHANHNLDWFPVVMMPGSSPMWHLANSMVNALSKNSPPNDEEISKTRLRLNRGADGFKEILNEFGFGKNQSLFILVDQFEEIFVFADEGGMYEASKFIELLVELHNSQLENVYLAITMRSDHLGDCSRFNGLSEVINNSQYLVPSMNTEELEKAICQPAEIYRGQISPELAQHLIRETSHNPDQLPLIQHALAYMWELEKQNTPDTPPHLDMKCYKNKSVKSAGKALSNHADKVLKELSKKKRLVQNIFRALTQIDNSGRAIRRRLTKNELIEEIGEVSDESIEKVINAFISEKRSFLIIEEANPKKDPKISISHEALIRHWKKLSDERLDKNGQPKGWVAREDYDGRIWQSLVSTVESDIDNQDNYLPKPIYKSRQEWREQLNPTPKWAEKYGNQYDKVTDLFERSKKKIEENARSRRITNSIIIMSVLAIVIGAIVFINILRNLEYQESISQSQTELARKGLKNLWQLRTKAQKEQQDRNYLYGNEVDNKIPHGLVADILLALEHIPEQKTNDGGILLVPEIGEALINALHDLELTIYVMDKFEGNVDGVAFSANAQLIATSSDNRARIWDAKTGKLLRELNVHSSSVDRITFNHTGSLLVSASIDRSALIWDVKSGNQLHALVGHSGLVWGVAWSPDDRFVATSSDDKTIRIWDAQNGTFKFSFEGHTDIVFDIEFSPHGNFLASASSDKTIRIWDLSKKKEINKFEGHSQEITSISWSPDGNYIALGGGWERKALILDSKTGKTLSTLIHEGAVKTVAFSPNSQTLATGSWDKLTRIWDVKSGKLLRTLKGPNGAVNDIAWLPNGKQLIIGAGDGTARLFDLSSPPKTTLNSPHDVQAIIKKARDRVPKCYSEEERIALLLPTEIPNWCHELKKPPFDAQGRLKKGIDILYSTRPDFEAAQKLFQEAKRLAPPRSDEIDLKVLEALKEIGLSLLEEAGSYAKINQSIEDSQKYFDLAVKLDPKLTPIIKKAQLSLFINSGKKMLVEGKKIEAQKAFDKAISLDPNVVQEILIARIKVNQQIGKLEKALLLALELNSKNSDNFVPEQILSELLSEEVPKTFLKGHNYPVYGVAYSPDNKLIAYGSDDKTIRIWDAQSGELLKQLTGHQSNINRITFSPDGKFLVSASADNMAIIWDVRNGKKTHELKGHSDIVWGVAWSNKNQIATSSYDKTIRIWDPNTGQPISTLSNGHKKEIKDIAFAPNGEHLLSVSEDGYGIIWDITNSDTVHTFKISDFKILSAAWSSDGESIATGGNDNKLELRKVTHNGIKLSETINNKGGITSIAFSPNGKWLAIGSDNGPIYIWNTDKSDDKSELVKTLKGGINSVTVIAWSPNNKSIVSGSGDDAVRIYDVSHINTLEESYVIRAQKRVTRCFTAKERKEMRLSPEVPKWCDSLNQN